MAAAWEHRVRRERLVVDAATPELAMALRPRLEDLNRRALVPVIEAVLAELAPPGRQVRIHRLELELGDVSARALEEELPRRLAAELRRALGDALRGGPGEPAPGVAWRDEAEARAELLEWQLARGTLPYWAPRSSLSLEAQVAEMADGDPVGLAATVRRLGRWRVVLERLTAQLRDPALAALARALEPEHAALVLAYVTELRRVHRRAPLLPLGERRFRRLLWVLAQAYLVRAPGSRFNRKRFLRSLLLGMAADQGLDYGALLATLRARLQGIRRHRAAAASLPRVLASLLHDLRHGPPSRAATSTPASAPDRVDVDGWARGGAADGTAGVDAGDSAGLLDRWDSADAVDTTGAVTPADGEDLETWATRVADLDDADAPEGPGAAGGSRGGPGRVHPPDDVAAAGDPRLAGVHAPPPDAEDARTDAAAAFAPYDRAEALAYLLRHGVLPWDAVLRDPALDAEALAVSLVGLPHPLLLAALRADDPAARRRSLAALARWLPEAGFARLLSRLLPAAAKPDTPFAQAVRDRAAAAPDRRAFLAGVADAALAGGAIDLDLLASAGNGGGEEVEPRPDELTAWPAHLLQSALTRALGAGTAPSRGDPSPADLLDALVAAHPADARHYLRIIGGDYVRAPELARCVPTPLHDRLVELLAPAAVRAIGALQGTLAALPAPERRFSADELRQAVLMEVMRLDDGAAPGKAFFSGVLARLFGRRVPGAAGERLRAAVEGWIHPAGVPVAQVEAFRAAVAPATGTETDAAPADPPAAADPRPARVSAELREAVFAFLLGREPADAQGSGAAGVRAPGPAAETLRDALRQMADEAPEELRSSVRRHSADGRVRERWVQLLPESALARLSGLAGPRLQATLLDTAETLAAAWTRAAPAGYPGVAGRAAFWNFLLEFLSGSAGASGGDERLVEAFFADRAACCRRLSPVPDLARTGARLLREASRLAHARGNARLRGILHRHRERLLAAWAPSAEAAGASTRRTPGALATPALARGTRTRAAGRPGGRPPAGSPGARGGGDDEGDTVYVGNAGLVLAGAFLPHLFQELGLLGKDDEEKPRMRDADAASRAVHLLQYLVDGSTDTPEPLLVLNKLLCGVRPETPVERAIQPDERERGMCDRLLGAMLARWPALDHTSVQGLRETFLQREGRLDLAPGRLRLTVQRKTLDVLVDQVPWSVSLVFHGWMPEPLHVTW